MVSNGDVSILPSGVLRMHRTPIVLLLVVISGCSPTLPSTLTTLDQLQGLYLPDNLLRTDRGMSITSGTLTRDSTTLAWFVDAEFCTSCANLAVDLKVLRRERPDLRQIMVVEPPAYLPVSDWIKRQRLRLELIQVGADPTPFRPGRPPSSPFATVILLGPDGRILLAGRHSGPQLSSTPISQQLEELQHALSHERVAEAIH